MGFNNGYEDGGDAVLEELPLKDPRVQRFLRQHGGGGGDIDPDDPRVKAIVDAKVKEAMTSSGFILTGGATSMPEDGFYVADYAPFVTKIAMPNLTELPFGCFGTWDSSNPAELSTVEFPLVTEVQDMVFNGCVSLKTASFPELVTVGQSAFEGSGLVNVDFPKVREIGMYAFGACEDLVSASFGSAETVGEYAFQACSSLKDVHVPVAVTLGEYAFENCTSLVEASFPEVVEVNSAVFSGCTALKRVSIPKVTYLNVAIGIPSVFNDCTSLEYVDLSSVEVPDPATAVLTAESFGIYASGCRVKFANADVVIP